MDDIIKEIELPEKTYFIKENEEELQEKDKMLKNLSKINIFIGENNSGKSRLLRSFIKSEKLNFIPYNPDFKIINEIIPILKSKLSKYLDTRIPTTTVRNEIIPILENINTLYILENKEDPNPILELTNHIEKLKRDNASIRGIPLPTIGEELEEVINECFNQFNISVEDINLNYKFKKIYIPILRGLRPFDGNDVYWRRTEDDYFSSKAVGNEKIDDNRVIFTGLNAYHEIIDHLLGRLEQRDLIKEFQDFLSEQFFDNDEITLIPDLKEDKILRIKIGDEKEKEIYNLGDGIQSIIIMTLPLFLYKDRDKDENKLFFIEEPEHLLHPGLQRKLIETFNDERFDNYQFFITTHSNHFLDITLDYTDVSIFFLRKELDDSDSKEKSPNFSIESLSYGDTNALDLLGVRNTSVFLSNCTIWVEGITDRYYIKKYFDIYQEYLKKEAEDREIEFMEFREDYHYSFVEYSGGNITHWSFLDDEEKTGEEDRINVDRLCSKLFLIADSDNKTTGAKAERHKKLKEILKNRFYLLKAKEIENILSKNVLLEVVKDYESKEDRTELDYDDSYTEEEYQNECLGEFIEDKILKGNRNRSGSYQKKNKDGNCVTITDKTNFCKYALNHIKAFEDLSNEAKEICNSLYQFIAVENGHDRSSYVNICEELGLPYEIIDFEDNESEPDIPEENIESKETETKIA